MTKRRKAAEVIHALGGPEPTRSWWEELWDGWRDVSGRNSSFERVFAAVIVCALLGGTALDIFLLTRVSR